MKSRTMPSPAGTEPARAEWIDVVIRKVEALRFGSVQIIVHDGRVTQIESLEKTRFAPAKDPSNPDPA